jgi:hypothetical protein
MKKKIKKTIENDIEGWQRVIKEANQDSRKKYIQKPESIEISEAYNRGFKDGTEHQRNQEFIKWEREHPLKCKS